MASLESLPTETLINIVGFLPSKADIGNVRLVNRRLSEIATPTYFASIPLYAHWQYEEDDDDPPWPNDIEYDAHVFKNILENERLSTLVRSVDIYTCNPDCDHKPTWANGYDEPPIYDGAFPGHNFDDVWEECFSRLQELPNFDGITIIYDRHGGGDGDSYDDEHILQTPMARHDRLKTVFHAMGTRIRHLSLRHFQDIIWAPRLGSYCCETHRRREDDERSELAFATDNSLRESILKSVESLQMSMVHEQPRGESGTILTVTDIHDYWKQFPSRWLLPAASSLKRLELYSDVAFGWYPKLDLRGVHLPKLESLGLGHFIFSRDQQFDWIISHWQTLKELFFDNCSILYQIGHGSRQGEDWLDEDGCPCSSNGSWFAGGGHGPYFVSYSARWHDVFNRFSHSLPKLKAVHFGSSTQWDFDTPCRFDDAGPGLPIVPWRSKGDMKNEMFERRYVIYSNFTERYRPDWKTPTFGEDDTLAERYGWAEDEEPDVVPQMDERPDCADDDWAAFRSLQRRIGQA